MVYSVWDPVSKTYNYYQTPASASDLDSPNPTHLKQKRKSAIGLGNDIAWPLPLNAQPIGHGAMPVGMIAAPVATGGGALGDVSLNSPWVLAALVGVAFLLLRK